MIIFILFICPYQAGFFITVPTKDVQEAQEIAAIMREDDIFVVPLGAGLRVAICAIPEEKITGPLTVMNQKHFQVKTFAFIPLAMQQKITSCSFAAVTYFEYGR